MNLRISAFFSLLMLGWALGACSDDTQTTPPDARLDAPFDGGADVAGADLDVGSDGGAELAVDLPGAIDSTPDASCGDPGVTLDSGIHLFPTNLEAGQRVTLTYPASGALGGRDNLTLHYGFNYWSLDLGGAVSREAAMVRQGDGSFEVSVDLPAGARLMDFVFYSESSGNKTWDNNDGADYHRAVGVPYVGPYLTFVDNTAQSGPARDPARSITVSFQSDRDCRAGLRFGTSATLLDQRVVASSGGRYHHLRLTGLTPDTTYHYRVSCVDPQAACAFPEASPTYSFRTAPDAAESFRFFFISDPQDNRNANDRWKDVAAAMAQKSAAEARFVVVAGDLAGDDLPERWWDFFDKGRALFSSRAMVPAVGNHDTPTYGSHADTSSFESYFSTESSSGKDTYYAVTYGNTSFVVLNSETAQSWVSTTDWAPGGAQYEWVKAKLSALQSDWTFAVWHIPPYNAGVRHIDQNGSTRRITSLFDGKVDWVLCGHEHMYQRSKPIQYVDGSTLRVVASYGRGVDDGVGYLIAPAAGHDAPADTFAASDPIMSVVGYPQSDEINGGKIAPWVGHVEIAVDQASFSLAAHALGAGPPKDSLSYSRP